MADIVVCGAGTCGLITAMLLADDGHDVTVIERDPEGPAAVDDVWDGWERRGVNQFRQPHFLLSRFRWEMARHLPRLLDALVAAGAYEMNFFGPLRDAVPDAERLDVTTARRPVLEAVVADVAARTPRVTIRRGLAIEGLTVGTSVRAGVPHVTGVRLGTGEEVSADLVVAALGRRSPFGRWVTEAGGRPPEVHEEDCGFVYYGAYMAPADGEQRVPVPVLEDFGSVTLIALPADRGTVGVGIIGSSQDAALRKLRHEGPWRRVLARLPGAEPLLDMAFISELLPMAGIEDIRRRFVVDGAPVVTGAVAVADAWAATNPMLGRGISLGTLHSIALRDVVRSSLDDPYRLALDFDAYTEEHLTPWYDGTVWQDRHRLAVMAAEAGLGPAPQDPEWLAFRALSTLFRTDLDLALKWAMCSAYLEAPPVTLLADHEVRAKVEALDFDPAGRGGPARSELLALVEG